MLHLFKFIDSGFLLTLGLLLLIGGSIMLYCYRRLNLLERSIIEHGKILQNFIINYNNQMNSLSLFEDCNSEKCNQKIIKKINIDKKIPVSDDENEKCNNNEDEDDDDDVDDDEDGDGEDDDDEDDEDDDDEDDDDEDDDDEDEGEEDDDIRNNNNTKNIIELVKHDSKKSNNTFDIKEINESKQVNIDNEIQELVEVNESPYLNCDEDIFIKNLPILLNSVDEDLERPSKVITLENNLETIQKVEKRNYSKMRIDDLRMLVVTKNIMDNDSAQKMKKNDLVKILQK